MSSDQVYRASFYLMLTVSTVILTGDSTTSGLDWLLPFVVALGGLLAFLTVDQKPQWSLPRSLANLLALATIVPVYLEYNADSSQLIRCLGHWVVYLQLVKYILPKTAEDDWFLFLLGLMQVLIGSVVNQSDLVGAMLVVWTLLAVWVLGLFFLQREARRYQLQGAVGAPADATNPDPYAGLFDFSYLAATAKVLAITLLLGGLFFLMLPRKPGVTKARPGPSMAKHLTGFDDEVRLGQLGEILENDSIVMNVEFTDDNHQTKPPPAEPLWRGVTLAQYEGGRWRRPPQNHPHSIASFPISATRSRNRDRLIRQTIKLEPNDSSTLFALRPVVELSAGFQQQLSPFLNPIDGTIFRPEYRGSYEYQVCSDSEIDSPQPGELPPSAERRRLYLSMPESLKQRLRAIALPLVENLPGEGITGTEARARALESYLRDSGEFGYTLEMAIENPRLDPVEDFLLNRKEGHCEYFASALALLLRSIDIPCRLINGFKGGDWNDLTRTMNIRQKHAHSWVEAYLGTDDRGHPLWITLDPTPGAERERSIAQVGTSPSVLPFADTIRYIWVFYIQGYDAERQNRLIYTPLRFVAREVRQGYALLWSWVKQGVFSLFHFPNFGSLISVRGFIVSFLVLSAVTAVVLLLRWIATRLFRWWRGSDEESASLTAGIQIYRRLSQLLAAHHIERGPCETHGEFARRAGSFLRQRGLQVQAIADVPGKVVDAFHQVRFGHRELDPADLVALEASLDSLESSLGER